ncbi:sialate O-acetylesterase, partial [Balneolaceae bacterium ANBcel3]|nr:sialate O-acetylesterase [Balneolaceae bacterium ANBcel3]
LFLLSSIALITCTTKNEKLKLPRLVSDHMVLQRNTDVRIWGWAASNELIHIHFNNKEYQATADRNGNWHVFLDKMDAGGPYTMTISASDTSIILNDILVGDVWVCSGQSNMELQMSWVAPLYKEVIEGQHHPHIRQFLVPKVVDFNTEQKDLPEGEWVPASVEAIRDFSAAAYFFARDLFAQNGVPIGLINSSYGGSPVESWISEQKIKDFPEYHEAALKYKDTALIERIEREDQARISEWHGRLNEKDRVYLQEQGDFRVHAYDDSGWSEFSVPGFWDESEVGEEKGAVWFRKNVELSEKDSKKPAVLELGAIIDADSVFVNGAFIGTTTYRYPLRIYEIPEGVLREGKNTIALRVVNERDRGGFVEDKPYELRLQSKTIGLQGPWKYRRSVVMEPLDGPVYFRNMPVGLYNGMIHPLTYYPVKGVIWYQGESNAWRPHDYHALFTTLIRDWRTRWGNDSMPFFFVQLPDFGVPSSYPADDTWPFLREAQLKTLELPYTGMAVTIDIGEWNDIHPLNKKDVGIRLAHVANRVAYGEEINAVTGPVFQSYQRAGTRMVLSFDHGGNGLIAADGNTLYEFIIAGPDKQFVPAQAVIDGENVVVWSDQVSDPQAVRYAWRDNPEQANLFGGDGFPASPFRTDSWDK